MYDYPRNEFIKDKELLVVNETGENLGKLSLKEALKAAQESELDLVVVSPNAKPPVAKIMPWSKFKYEQEKKRKDSRGKNVTLKEMWFKSFIGDNDLNHKLKKVNEFLDKKHPVKLTIKAKGRVNRDQTKDLLERILEKLGDKIEYENKPKFQGRNLSLIVRPSKKS